MWSLVLQLCSAYSIAAVNIDDKIDSPFSTECFKRISIGERLVVYDVTRTAERKRVKDCEQDCFDYNCSFFSFGIAAAGNGTCELSTRREIARRQDADYDIYQRTKQCRHGQPTGYEQSCYRRVYVGRRLDERYIKHSLPCDTIQACQHQCSIEQHFQCHGFSIRLDESGLGRGICELTSTATNYLDASRDFQRDADFDFFEKDVRNTSPNCGYHNEVVSVIPKDSLPTENPGRVGRPDRPENRPWGPTQPGAGPWNYGTAQHPNEIPSIGDGKDWRYGHKPTDWPHGRSLPMVEPTSRLPGYVIVDADENRSHGSGRSYGGSTPSPWGDGPTTPRPEYGWNGGGSNSGHWNGAATTPGPQYGWNGAGSTPGPWGGGSTAGPQYGWNGAGSTPRPSYGWNPPANYPNRPPDYPNRPPDYPNRPPDYPNRPPDYPNRPPDYPNRPSNYPNRPPYDSHPQQPPHNYSPGWQNNDREVCYQREYPAMRMRTEMVRATYTFPKVSECESMCSSARFHCVGFTYRYAHLQDTKPNCYLADTRSVDTFSDLVQDRDCDVYFRIPTCQPIHSLPDTDCFTRVASETELMPEVLSLRVSAISLSECELECLRADTFICRSFSYSSGQGGDNCHLSAWDSRSLRGQQLLPSSDSALYERGSFGRGCEADVNNPPYIGPEPHHPPKHDYPLTPPDEWGREAWRHFTVRGWPCRKGTQCSLNREAGFWSCEVEGGDFSQWDYCCRPQHACGYSQGYSYPWCYVGEAGPDQWRPCSENFYPNYGRPNRPTGHRPFDSSSSQYGPPSQWPISYLYPGPPPNETVYFTPSQDFNGYLPQVPKPYQDSPRIQFRPTAPPSLPKAFVQKLDLKLPESSNLPSSAENTVSINPRNNFAKKLKDSQGSYVFSTSGGVSNSSNVVEGGTTTNFMTSLPYVNDTIMPKNVNKTKAILDQIEKIIEKEKIDCSKSNKSEVMESRATNGLGFSRSFINETRTIFFGDDNAMTRFWNWGQENYFSKKKRQSR